MNEEIDKYDMTLNGNMGYKGYLKYIEEIDKYCKSQKCLFLVEPLTNDKYDQNNQEIRDYISNNYNELETYTIFKIYTTEK
jgi:tagatose-1,6-bisphosphate aldolase